jgi:hypothetical protein
MPYFCKILGSRTAKHHTYGGSQERPRYAVFAMQPLPIFMDSRQG